MSKVERFIFTVSTGRCGQASLTNLLGIHVPGCYPAFEEPQVRPILPPPLASYERLLRRRFIESHELLGRGRVLRAYEQRDQMFIDRIVAKRLAMIRRTMKRKHSSIYFDVSKFFARGLHAGFSKAVDRFALVHLVRDPVQNMRSYLNRNKNFALDNNRPDARSNILRMNSAQMTKGELYLWAWCEMGLRFEALSVNRAVTHAVEIRTDDLNHASRMSAAFEALELPHRPFEARPALNTNPMNGFAPTQVTAEDVRAFERFLTRVPADLRRRIAYLRRYDPWTSNGLPNPLRMAAGA